MNDASTATGQFESMLPHDDAALALYSNIGEVSSSESGPDPSALYSVVNKEKALVRKPESSAKPTDGAELQNEIDSSRYAPIDIFARKPVADASQDQLLQSASQAPGVKEESFGFEDDII